MSKLYFRYGAMGSAKTLLLLAVAHNYQSQGKKAVIFKPKIDDRYGIETVKSRAGLEAKADLVIESMKDLSSFDFSGLDCILVDEAQFLSAEQINYLRDVGCKVAPVICFGLRTDYSTHAFPGSKRLLEVADSIEEIKTTCHFCCNKAIFNMRLLNGEPTLEGGQVLIGGDESYVPSCYRCYSNKLGLPR